MKNTSPEASPRPWRIQDYGTIGIDAYASVLNANSRTVFEFRDLSDESYADAQHIVNCVNSKEELVRACETARAYMVVQDIGVHKGDKGHTVFKRLTQALSKAETE